jgi:hypothetical protein
MSPKVSSIRIPICRAARENIAVGAETQSKSERVNLPNCEGDCLRIKIFTGFLVHESELFTLAQRQGHGNRLNYSKVSYLRSVLDARSLNGQVAEHQRFSAL